jgi:hypothetical protein
MTQEQANWEWIDARVKRLEEHCFSPVKELTDEEILDLASYAGENPTKYDMVDFARAILRKATK